MTSRDLAQRLADLGDLPGAAARASREVEVLVLGAIRKGITDGVSPSGSPFKPLSHGRPSGGSKPLLDRGILRASVSVHAGPQGLVLRSNAPGARLHQHGGTVVPKRAKALAIPVTREAARAGSPRAFPRPLFVLKKAGDPRGGVLAERPERGGRPVVHYLLRRSVTVPARPFLGISKDTATMIGKVLSRRLALGR